MSLQLYNNIGINIYTHMIVLNLSIKEDANSLRLWPTVVYVYLQLLCNMYSFTNHNNVNINVTPSCNISISAIASTKSIKKLGSLFLYLFFDI